MHSHRFCVRILFAEVEAGRADLIGVNRQDVDREYDLVILRGVKIRGRKAPWKIDIARLKMPELYEGFVEYFKSIYPS